MFCGALPNLIGRTKSTRTELELSLGFPHDTILILIQATQVGRWLIFCQPVVHRLLSYWNENNNGYEKHLRSQTDLG